MKIDKSGFRKDLDNYFRIYAFKNQKQTSPFIVVTKDKIFKANYIKEIIDLPKETTVFHCWPGKYKSDVFVFTVEELLSWKRKQ